MAEKEYIERGALYKDVSSLEVVAYKSDNEDFNNGAIFILEKLDAIPAADVVEVQRGRWLYPYDDKNSSWVECSECGADISKQDAWQYLYCPHCGAKMDGERKEQK